MKSFHIVLTILAASTLLFLSSCGETIHGNGNVVEVGHEVDQYTEIDISGMFEVELLRGGSMVEVVTDENLHEHISVEVVEGELVIHTNDKHLEADELLLRIHYKDLESIDVSGAIEISSDKPINGKSFEFEVSGACDATLQLDVDRTEVSISGGGEMNLSGRADEADISISGAGEINAADLKTKRASIDITGAGEVEIDVTEELDVDITGAGEIRYHGEPQISQSITGAGSVEKL